MPKFNWNQQISYFSNMTWFDVLLWGESKEEASSLNPGFRLSLLTWSSQVVYLKML